MWVGGGGGGGGGLVHASVVASYPLTWFHLWLLICELPSIPLLFKIAHRDLKLENLLLVDDKNITNIKLADFGLAKVEAASKSLQTVCGTPQYVAPEVINEDGADHYGVEVDMWSAGIVLFVLLGGYPPFYDESEPRLFAAIQEVCDGSSCPASDDEPPPPPACADADADAQTTSLIPSGWCQCRGHSISARMSGMMSVRMQKT